MNTKEIISRLKYKLLKGHLTKLLQVSTDSRKVASVIP